MTGRGRLALALALLALLLVALAGATGGRAELITGPCSTALATDRPPRHESAPRPMGGSQTMATACTILGEGWPAR